MSVPRLVASRRPNSRDSQGNSRTMANGSSSRVEPGGLDEDLVAQQVEGPQAPRAPRPRRCPGDCVRCRRRLPDGGPRRREPPGLPACASRRRPCGREQRRYQRDGYRHPGRLGHARRRHGRGLGPRRLQGRHCARVRRVEHRSHARHRCRSGRPVTVGVLADEPRVRLLRRCRAGSAGDEAWRQARLRRVLPQWRASQLQLHRHHRRRLGRDDLDPGQRVGHPRRSRGR